MKRIIALLLSLVMLLPCFTFYSFAQEKKQLNFDLNIDGEHVAYAEAGSEITVDFNIENLTDAKSFTVTNLQNDIAYDHEFFEYVDGNVELVTATSSKPGKKSWGLYLVHIFGNHAGSVPKVYENNQLVARVTFKIKDGLADGTSGKLYGYKCVAADGVNGITYEVTNTAMTVYIGRAPVETCTVKYVDEGKTISIDNSVEVGSEITIAAALNQPDRKFGGWTVSGGQVFKPGNKYTVTGDVTFEAKWYDKVTVSFDENGGDEIEDKVFWQYDNVQFSDISAAREGYTFDGWYMEPELKNRLDSLVVVSDMTVYAGWIKIPEYKLTFKNVEEDEADKFGVITALKGTEIDLSSKGIPTKEGYAFTGWYTEKELQNIVSKVVLNEDMSVYAGWKINEYTVKFATNGGGDIPSVKAEHFSELDLTKEEYTLTREGYVFDGWYLDNGLTKHVTVLSVTGNTTVYAKWLKLHTLTFDTDGGTSVAPITQKYGEVIDISTAVTTKDGYNFAGWYTEPEFITIVASVVLTRDMTVYAKWIKQEEPTFTITFNTNGGETVGPVVDIKGTVVNLSSFIPVRNGYVFEGWYKEAALKNQVTSITLAEDVTVYAKWTQLFTLTFDTKKGSTIEKITEKAGTVVELSEYVPSRTGYKFAGWYADSELKEAIDSVTLNSDITVYAKWNKKTSESGGGGIEKCVITFEVNGGTKLDKVEKFENATVDLSKYITTREGYKFDGWHLDKECTQKVEQIKITENITLYAKWTELEDGETDKPINPNYKPDILRDDHIAYIVGREDGYIRPNANLTRAEAATVFFRLLDEDIRKAAMTDDNVFTDVNEDHWFNIAVSTLANLEIVNGRTGDTFAPNEPITRAELTTIVARLSDMEYEGKNLFDDISGHWAADYINMAASIKWVEGDGNGLFRPNDNITRAEFMTLVNRSLNRQPESEDDLLEDMIIWPDNTDKTKWYYIAVQEATNSHEHQFKEDGVHEKWTKLIQNPDWSVYENQ